MDVNAQMDEARLADLLGRFGELEILVVGDFFLDKYLIIERALSETSLETGLEAYQVVDVQCSPGAAGSVTSKLAALGARVATLGVVGDDGEGYELRRALEATGAGTVPLITQAPGFTPTYTKPMMREPDGREHELNRLDIKNRCPLSIEAEAQVLDHLRALVPGVDGVVIADQVVDPNCGVVTDRVRGALMQLARAFPDVIFTVDSRARIGLFQDIVLKPNAREAALALDLAPPPGDGSAAGDRLAVAREHGRALYRRARRPVFLTVGDRGILVCDDAGETLVPAVPVIGEIDIVGAGDSAMAGIATALCAGATPPEAALIGNLVASITIQQIGTTGTATRAQVLARFGEIGPQP